MLEKINGIIWGIPTLLLFVGTGIYLMIKLRFLPIRNLGYALKSVLGKKARSEEGGEGDITAFSALTTMLAATIGTGNIVGVATAMILGGPGALVWMWISALLGLATMLSECTLAVMYRQKNDDGEMCGGPMYVMKNGFSNQRFGMISGTVFAFFMVIASFGIGNMTQANSISTALTETFGVSEYLTGSIIAIFILIVTVGGIRSIAKISQILVPVMAGGYLFAGMMIILVNWRRLPGCISEMFSMAFSLKSVSGGVGGMISVSMAKAARWGIARGVFSNEAGLGSASVTSSAAVTDYPARAGYIGMTGPFFDTLAVCTVTGLAISVSGVLGMVDPGTGELLTGAALTIAAFQSVFGEMGGVLISVSIVLFALATILGWEYQGEKAFEFLVEDRAFCVVYKILYILAVYLGATTSLHKVWQFSDIANGLMALPNLLCLLVMSSRVSKEILEFQKKIRDE